MNASKKQIIRTNSQCFTKKQAEMLFKSKVSAYNWELILDMLTHEDISTNMDGFYEARGELFLVADDETIEVVNNLYTPMTKSSNFLNN